MPKLNFTRIQTILFLAGMCMTANAFISAILIYAHGAQLPDISTGRIAPVEMHGILYVKTGEARLYEIFKLSGLAFMLVGLFWPYIARMFGRK